MTPTVTIDAQELAWMRETIRTLQREVEQLKRKQKEQSHMIAA